MRELRSLGSVRGVLGNRYSYRDPVTGTDLTSWAIQLPGCLTLSVSAKLCSQPIPDTCIRLICQLSTDLPLIGQKR